MADISRAVADYTASVREVVLPEIERWVTGHAGGHPLYRVMLDYPFRPAKGLRPALCIATSRALGGSMDGTLPTAAVLELLHNAFLVHDDVEDGSETRRGRPTLCGEYGTPIAVNVGDGMLALALVPLLANTEVLGLGPALTVLRRVIRTVQITVEGQALEFEWQRHLLDLPDLAEGHRAFYERLVAAKTAEYSFIAPIELGWFLGADASAPSSITTFARHLGIAFQITDDLLNLERASASYGKEHAGDLWEGKPTLMLLHALAVASTTERERALAILAKPRTGQHRLMERIAELSDAGELSAFARAKLEEALGGATKTADDVQELAALIARHGGLNHGRRIAAEHSTLAQGALDEVRSTFARGAHLDFIEAVTRYVVERLQ